MTVKKITESTLIPFGFALALIGGGAAWMTSVDASIGSVRVRQENIDNSYKDLQKDINEILLRVTKIDESVRHLEEDRR